VKTADIKEAFGLKIKLLRKIKKITQENLAAEIDVDVRTIKRIESGKYNPTLEIIANLSIALKTSLSDLFKDLKLLH
jgi:putative transcriptional regulator